MDIYIRNGVKNRANYFITTQNSVTYQEFLRYIVKCLHIVVYALKRNVSCDFASWEYSIYFLLKLEFTLNFSNLEV